MAIRIASSLSTACGCAYLVSSALKVLMANSGYRSHNLGRALTSGPRLAAGMLAAAYSSTASRQSPA